MRYTALRMLLLAVIGLVLCGQSLWAATKVKLVFPLGRTAYQTNERIDVAVLRSATEAMPASTLQLALAGADGSGLTFTFPVKAVTLTGDTAQAIEHVYLNGWLLRPGRYTVEATCDGATAQANFSVHSHLRQSSFRIIDWGSNARGLQQQSLGEGGFGFNLLLGDGGTDEGIRGGMDYMGCCVMGGGHQMELRMECDWSDPYVLQGATSHAAKFAFNFRTKPNAIGVHFYDEPGLTWWQHTGTGEFTPHNIPAQDAAYKAAFGTDAPQYNTVKGDDPALVKAWMERGRWKQGFMEATWQLGAQTISRIRPDFISATQTVYGWNAYGDGYYFNIARALPVISGHGGYDDLGLGYLTPSFAFEMGRARDLMKPNWYLPTWYGNMPSDRFRMEQYMSFINNLQGIAKPPPMPVQAPDSLQTAAGIVESNKLLAKLGTIFTTMPVDRPEAAMLYSMSQNLSAQIRDMTDNYTGGKHVYKLQNLYVASKMIQTRLFPIVEEDVLDGTLAAHHKVVVLTGIDYLDPPVVKALVSYRAGGGTVLLTDDCKVQIAGAVKLGAQPDMARSDRLTELWLARAGKSKEELDKIDAERARLNTVGKVYQENAPLAKALKAAFAKLGVKPDLVCDNTEIMASRQAQGDIEYFFAVNGAYDYSAGEQNSIKATDATISLPADGRPIYNAIHGGMASEFKPKGTALTAAIHFGAGAMRTYARTERPIGGVQIGTPVVTRDYTLAQNPVRVDVAATLVDAQQRVLAGSAPLQIKLIDPLGMVRYDLYRATDKGVCPLSLPLAINDPAGEWTVQVTDLLANTTGKATFAYTVPTQAGTVAGTAQRALYFGNDRQNIFRFFQTHAQITIAVGNADYEQAAAERLAAALKPWGIRSSIIKAAEVQPKNISEVEAKTMVSRFSHAGRGGIKPGQTNAPLHVGFETEGPVVLLGSPQSNPLVKFLGDHGFLPYKVDATMPGSGRALLAWQLEGLRFNQESITVIATDAAGMAEGIGSLYEAAAGLNPLTPWALPETAGVKAATRNTAPAPAAAVAWQGLVPDRADWASVDGKGTVTIHTIDGTLTSFDAVGKPVAQKAATAEQRAQKPAISTDVKALPADMVRTDRVVKSVVTGNGLTAVAYWGGLLQTFDAQGALKSEQQLQQDIAAVVWAGDKLIIAQSDGKVLALIGK